MDATYEWACAQVGLPVHPRLLRDFSDFTRDQAWSGFNGQPEILCIGGARAASAGNFPPIRDADVVAVCLLIQSWAKTVAVPPLVKLDLTGELITCEGARTIAAMLQVDCGLRAVSLRQTRVSDDGAAALGAVLGGSKLAELDLGDCAISDTGARLFARGLRMHGPPDSLTTLLLDGNPINDAGVVDLIALVESYQRPPALRVLSLHPPPPRSLSMEVSAALRVVCELSRIDLREPHFEAHQAHSSASWGSATGDMRSDGGNSMLAFSSDMVTIGDGLGAGSRFHQAAQFSQGLPAPTPSSGSTYQQHPQFPPPPRRHPITTTQSLGGTQPANNFQAMRAEHGQVAQPTSQWHHAPSLQAAITMSSQMQCPAPSLQPPLHAQQSQAASFASPLQQAPLPLPSPLSPQGATLPQTPQSLNPQMAALLQRQALQSSQTFQTPQANPGDASMMPSGAMTPTGRSSSRHLAEWMAGTERELRELKWLFGASLARVDGQHAGLMQELEKLRGQVDVWADSAAGDTAGSGSADEARLEDMEARFDALDKLVGREQSECAQMWQLVEAAASVTAGASGDASRPAASPYR